MNEILMAIANLKTKIGFYFLKQKLIKIVNFKLLDDLLQTNLGKSY